MASKKIQSFASFKYKDLGAIPALYMRQKIQNPIALQFKAIYPKLGIAWKQPGMNLSAGRQGKA